MKSNRGRLKLSTSQDKRRRNQLMISNSKRCRNHDISDSLSRTIDDKIASDSESALCISGAMTKNSVLFDGLIGIENGGVEHDYVKKKLISSMEINGKHTEVVAIHRNSHSSISAQARAQTFRIYSEAVSKKCNGDANIRHAWFAGSREELTRIVNFGFIHKNLSETGELSSCGLNLYPESASLDSLIPQYRDENGLHYVLLCRVILGNTEEVPSNSQLCHPSSEEFDSGVDTLLSPRRYIVWPMYMNTHVLPEYLISFKLPSFQGGLRPERMQANTKQTRSPWMTFPCLISVLSRILPSSKINLIQSYHHAFLERKISRVHLVQHVRQLVGDKLLISTIKCFQAQQLGELATSIKDETPCSSSQSSTG